LKTNLPNFTYECVQKHKDEWMPFLVALKNSGSYSFSTKTCPIVFTVEGQLIGDSESFSNWAKKRFGREHTIPKELLIK